MSRTKRFIPYWTSLRNSIENSIPTWNVTETRHRWEKESERNLFDHYKNNPDVKKEVNRDRWFKGYDKHKATSYVRDNYFKRWTEASLVTGTNRKYYKRSYHRQRRKIEMKQGMEGWDYEG